MFTFAYGGYLDVTRMREIAPDIRFVSRAHFPDHTIGFPILHEGIPQIAAIPRRGVNCGASCMRFLTVRKSRLLTGLRESSAEKVNPVIAAYYGP